MSDNNRTVLRRQALRIGGATLVGISGLASGIGSAVLERPAQENDGATQEETLVASSEEVDIGAGESVETWLYKEQFPGPELRVSEGETLRVSLSADLASETSSIRRHRNPLPELGTV